MGWPDHADALVVDQIIAASKSSAFKHVYFLGPYAQRVSFASQQHRALNLLWALREKKHLAPGHRIAVIGAGVAGVMAAAALLELEFRIDLYESAGAALNRQSSAAHRYLHPTINRWPELPLLETTEVPYFDWLSDACSKVVTGLDCEWGEIKSGAEGRLHFEKGADVTGFLEDPREEPSVAVLTATPIDLNEERYECVIVTCGFADEDTQPPTDPKAEALKRYWDSEDLVREVRDAKVKPFLVSGAGDGGLIDCIRIAFEGCEDGHFIVEVARQLDATAEWKAPEGGRAKIIAAERAASLPHYIQDAIDLGSEKLEETYRAVAASLPEPVAGILKKSVRKGRPGLVHLFSLGDSPFTPLAAPIHKLLLAFALKALVVKHEKARVVNWGNDFIEVEKLEPGRNGKAGPVIPLTGRTVIRHGAKPSFAKFFAEHPKAAEDLILSQKRASAELDRPLWQTDRSPLIGWPPAPPFPDALVRRESQVIEFILRALRRRLVGRLGKQDDWGFRFHVNTIYKNCADLHAALGRLPKTIFGFNLEWVWDEPPELRLFGSGKRTKTKDPEIIQPGIEMVSALSGRLGPLVVDERGTAFALAASHTTYSSGGWYEGPIFDAEDRIVGTVMAPTLPEPENDFALIKLADARALEPRYGRLGPITGIAEPNELFGHTVHMLDHDGQVLDGTVNTTYSPARYRLAGQSDHMIARDAVRIRAHDARKGFGKPGDSGTPVVDSEGRLLGLVLGGVDEFTYVAPVKNFMEREALQLLAEPRKAESPGSEAVRPAEVAEQVRIMAELNRENMEEEPFILNEAIVTGESS